MAEIPDPDHHQLNYFLDSGQSVHHIEIHAEVAGEMEELLNMIYLAYNLWWRTESCIGMLGYFSSCTSATLQQCCINMLLNQHAGVEEEHWLGRHWVDGWLNWSRRVLLKAAEALHKPLVVVGVCFNLVGAAVGWGFPQRGMEKEDLNMMVVWLTLYVTQIHIVLKQSAPPNRVGFNTLTYVGCFVICG